MGGVCRVRNCFRSKDKCPDLPFFSFPKNPISARKWIINIGDPELLKCPPSTLKNHVVCALHFEDKYFVNKKKRSLVRNAIPTLFNVPPFKSEESHKKNKHIKHRPTGVPQRTEISLNPGAIFSCNVGTIDNWHRQIDAVTEQLLSLLPEANNQAAQVEEPQQDKHYVDAGTQYSYDESDLREFENRLNDVGRVFEKPYSDASPKVQLLCRLCSRLMHRECVVPVFSYEGGKIELKAMIDSIMTTKVIQDDGLPQQVCSLCVKKLKFCYEVRNEFLASEKKLRELLSIPASKEPVAVLRKRRRVNAVDDPCISTKKESSAQEPQRRRRAALRSVEVAISVADEVPLERPQSDSQMKDPAEGTDKALESGNLQEPVNDALQETVNESFQEIVIDAFQVPVNDVLEETVNDAFQETVNKALQETVSGTMREPVNDVLRESLIDGLRVNDSLREPVISASREHINNAAKEVVNDALRESVNDSLREREPITDGLMEPVIRTLTELVNDAAKEAVNVTVKESAKDTIKEPLKGVVEEPVNETVNNVVEEPVNDIVEEPVNDIVEEPLNDIVEEPVNDYAEEKPVNDIVEEPVNDIMEEPMNEIVEEPVNDILEEPVNDILEEPVNDAMKESVNDAVKGAVEDAVRETVVGSVKEHVEEPVDCAGKDLEKDNIKCPVRDAIKDHRKGPLKDGVKHSVREAVKGTGKDLVKDVVKHPVRDVVKRSVREGGKRPVRTPAKDNRKKSVNESLIDSRKGSVKDSVKDSRRSSVKDNRRSSVKNVAEDNRKGSANDAVKDNRKDAVKDQKKLSVTDAARSDSPKNLPKKRKKPSITEENEDAKKKDVKKMKLSKRGPQSENAADESDFENDSNYEIHWYDEAYEDSISEDIASNDSFTIGKRLSPNDEKEMYTSEDTEEAKESVTGDESKKTDKDEIVNTINHQKLNKSSLNDTSSVSTTDSSPSVIESVISGTIRPKLGPGSVRVRLMTERQKTLRIRNKAKIKLLKQAGKKNILNAKNSCLECKRNFSSKLKLEQHLLIHQRFECRDCNRIFITAEELSNHRKSHMGPKQDEFTNAGPINHLCEVCKRTFKTRQRLLIHSKTHTARKSFTCSMCHEAFTTRIRLREHLKMHKTENSFECLICHASFKSNKALLQHGVQHSESLASLKCEICGAIFTDIKDHEKHREQHAPSARNSGIHSVLRPDGASDVCSEEELKGDSENIIDNAELTVVHDNEVTKSLKEDGVKVKVPHLEKNLIITSSDKFVCDICDCKFSSLHFQEEHKKTHHSSPPVQDSVPEPPVVEVIVELPQKPERGKMYFCDQCGEGYERKRSLALHRFSHTSSHRCSNCYQSFSSEESLSRHHENCLEIRDE